MFGLTDQIDISFNELMEELRAIRQELTLIRMHQEMQNGSARTNLRSVRGKTSSKKKTA
jgi:hypothetical protein